MTSDHENDERPRAVVFAVLPGGGRRACGARPAGRDQGAACARPTSTCVGEIVQHRAAPRPALLSRAGQAAGTARRRSATPAATVAVCEDDLTPAQVAAVLDAVDVDVLDRTELILSVFARHAHSLEGRLQVDLAQLQYELTRVRGQGHDHVAARRRAPTCAVPARQKLEVDRRVITAAHPDAARQRIERMARTRRTQRARRVRADVPLIALAGYTNAGKSTLLNALTDAGVSVRDRLFETLDPTTRAFRYRDRDYVVTDTVGFIRKLPHLLVDAFASTLEETSDRRSSAGRRRRAACRPTRSSITRRRSPTSSTRSARPTCPACWSSTRSILSTARSARLGSKLATPTRCSSRRDRRRARRCS